MIRRLAITALLSVNILLGAIIFMPSSAAAATCGKSDASFLGFPTWYKYLTVDDKCNIELPKDSSNPPKTDFGAGITKILLAVFEIILRIGGLAAVGFVIYGGIQYILSQGDPDKTKGARSTIINALVGMAIAISATAIVNLIGRNIAS